MFSKREVKARKLEPRKTREPVGRRPPGPNLPTLGPHPPKTVLPTLTTPPVPSTSRRRIQIASGFMRTERGPDDVQALHGWERAT